MAHLQELDDTLDEIPSLPMGESAVGRDFLFVIFDCNRPLRGASRYALDSVDEVDIGRSERAAARYETRATAKLHVGLPSPFVSRPHARIRRTRDGWELIDLGSRNGSTVNGRRVTGAVPLRDGDLFECGRTILILRRRLEARISDPNAVEATATPRRRGLVTLIPALDRRHSALERIAGSRLSVLLLGESGTGKEVFARSVHERSGRTGEFVPVNCGGVPTSLFESMLFGHVKGAFSGAVRDERGLFRAAHGGTLFLDELGDMPPAAQAVLLRVLEDGRVYPVGSTRAFEADVRIVAATLRPMDDLVAKGEFRADLLARLSAFTHVLEPLRSRREDFGLIVGALLPDIAGAQAEAIEFTVDAALALLGHSWSLNIRELKQCLASALALSDEPIIRRGGLPRAFLSPAVAASGERSTRNSLLELIRAHRGNVAAVARQMQKDPAQVRRWIARERIDLDAIRRESAAAEDDDASARHT
jgi:DNA-binding NtrC family response regulator